MKRLRKDTVKKRIFFTIFIILLVRLGNLIPIPYIEQKYLIAILNAKPWLKSFFNSETLILSIFSLGILPSINASILIQILTNVIPYLEVLQKEEGESGRKKIKQYTRSLTVIFSLTESLGIALALKPIIFNWNLGICAQICLILTTGSMIVLWLSDLITENGIGNGSSLMITLNIFSALPNTIRNLGPMDTIASITNLISFISLMLGIILLQGAVKLIPLVSAKQLLVEEKSQKTQISFLPIKLNPGGVMPIIFSSTCFTVFGSIFNFFFKLDINSIELLNTKNLSLVYGIINFFLIFTFSRLYSSLILNPKEIAKQLNKGGLAIENIRPGKKTAIYLKKILNQVSFLGALFLATLIALPNIGNAYGLGTTSLIILVGVTTDSIRQIETLLISKKYYK
jgi:preprotein translocase subunit SecY